MQQEVDGLLDAATEIPQNKVGAFLKYKDMLILQQMQKTHGNV